MVVAVLPGLVTITECSVIRECLAMDSVVLNPILLQYSEGGQSSQVLTRLRPGEPRAEMFRNEDTGSRKRFVFNHFRDDLYSLMRGIVSFKASYERQRVSTGH